MDYFDFSCKECEDKEIKELNDEMPFSKEAVLYSFKSRAGKQLTNE